jgi:hypothetical protein
VLLLFSLLVGLSLVAVVLSVLMIVVVAVLMALGGVGVAAVRSMVLPVMEVVVVADAVVATLVDEEVKGCSRSALYSLIVKIIAVL